jgi:nucleotide-binding universal stress UspA family protein
MTQESAAGRIIVGVDGSDHSVAALRWAAEEARHRDLGVRVVTCWNWPTLPWGPYTPSLPASEEELAEQAAEVAKAAIDKVFGPAPEVEVAVEVLQGAPSLRLLEFDRIGEMIVVGSRGRGGFAGLLLGSVSQHLAEHARCPVVIVHGGASTG